MKTIATIFILAILAFNTTQAANPNKTRHFDATEYASSSGWDAAWKAANACKMFARDQAIWAAQRDCEDVYKTATCESAKIRTRVNYSYLSGDYSSYGQGYEYECSVTAWVSVRN
jgi:hypothetical protein